MKITIDINKEVREGLQKEADKRKISLEALIQKNLKTYYETYLKTFHSGKAGKLTEVSFEKAIRTAEEKRTAQINVLMFELFQLNQNPTFHMSDDPTVEDDSIEVTPLIHIQCGEDGFFSVSEWISEEKIKNYAPTSSVSTIIQQIEILTAKK